ncbi:MULTISPECIES: ArsR/SmtB family transcription factor [Streptomyces]|uniref:ArsR/SmtB family transcription factor n=1 Tax=Streptomyces sp. NPDC005386 TaxID=3154562 RepID=UPI0033B7DB7C
MGHAPDAQTSGMTAAQDLERTGATTVATTLQALAHPSRLRILARLQAGPCSPSELAAAAQMQQSACAHQLRLLRNLGLVTVERHGKSAIYSLYGDHVAQLLQQALYHIRHLRADSRC